MICVCCSKPVELSQSSLWLHSDTKAELCFVGEIPPLMWTNMSATPTCPHDQHEWVDTGEKSKYFPTASTVSVCSTCGTDMIEIAAND